MFGLCVHCSSLLFPCPFTLEYNCSQYIFYRKTYFYYFSIKYCSLLWRTWWIILAYTILFWLLLISSSKYNNSTTKLQPREQGQGLPSPEPNRLMWVLCSPEVVLYCTVLYCSPEVVLAAGLLLGADQAGAVDTVHHQTGAWRGVFNSAANRLNGEVVQSRRRPLLGPSPGWKHLLAISHFRHY